MPIVFVHGVNTRKDASYSENERVRDELFRKFALDGIAADPQQATILNPYWGDAGASFAWKHASLPDDQYESFGSQGSPFETVLTESGPRRPTNPATPVLDTARESLARGVDCLWVAAAFTDDAGTDVAAPLAVLAWKAAAYAEANPKPAWLAQVSTDDEFVDRLLQELDKYTPADAPAAPSNQDAVESFGVNDVWNHLKTAVTNIGNAAAGMVVNPLVEQVRPIVHHKASLFIGDVFVYLKSRGDIGTEGPIVSTVKQALEAGAAAKKAGVDDKLLVVAHSMGGNIVYDILSYYAKNIEVDLLLTVGSQVGMFEELKLFRASDPAIVGPKRVPPFPNVKRWINVLDPSDVLAYATSRIFDGNFDTKFDTGAPVWSAHGMYFYKPNFHRRVAARLKQV